MVSQRQKTLIKAFLLCLEFITSIITSKIKVMILINVQSNAFSLSSGSVWSRCVEEMSPVWIPPIWTRHQTKGASLPQQTVNLERCPPLLFVCPCPCATWRSVRMKRKSQSRVGMEVQTSSLYQIVKYVLCREGLVWLNKCIPLLSPSSSLTKA